MSREDRLEALGRFLDSDRFEVPVLPGVAAELLGLSNNPKASVSDFDRLVHRDPAMCAHLLRVANSPLYGTRTEIRSIRQAIMRLGTKTLFELAASVAAGQAVFRGGAYAHRMTAAWESALIRAGWARDVSRHRRKGVESAFLCGMLARIGEPLVLRAIECVVGEREESADAWADTIDMAVDRFQAVAGVRLADEWKLPGAVRACISREVEGPHRELVWVSVLSDALATWSQAQEESAAPVSHVALGELDLYPDDLETIAARCELVLASVKDLAA